jgi:hypothetical protein
VIGDFGKEEHGQCEKSKLQKSDLAGCCASTKYAKISKFSTARRMSDTTTVCVPSAK